MQEYEILPSGEESVIDNTYLEVGNEEIAFNYPPELNDNISI